MQPGFLGPAGADRSDQSLPPAAYLPPQLQPPVANGQPVGAATHLPVPVGQRLVSHCHLSGDAAAL